MSTPPSEIEQIETAHIFVNDFLWRINNSEVEISPEILSAVLIKKAGHILMELHKDSIEEFITAVSDNCNQVYLMAYKGAP